MLLSSCASKNIKGTYQSIFADAGMFITTINFKTENKFEYIISGDLPDRNFTGYYQIKENIVYLKFDPPKEEDIVNIPNDSIKSIDLILFDDYHDFALKNDNGMEYHQKLLIRKNKLLVYRIASEELIKRIKKYSENNNFLFPGTKVKTKRYFLKKID
ncbi:hypothetical protein DFR65_1155 [Oceanihabitans sediminis]|uniref:Uncharacterized protein n=1 Tax=Oceanihabitans sediminis TaxID=1812012 RepID=A0A368P1V1_9FLAO|nr:hypothetical protein DFR65_1155 [Oceanihabitans sediminis]RCU56373.1 hypothetical protein DU428_13190 [Oceanihabitans sediminis]